MGLLHQILLGRR